MPVVPRLRPLVFCLAAVLASPGLVLARGPLRLELHPSAVPKPGQSMKIAVSGVEPGVAVLLQVLRDCTGDGKPELRHEGSCVSPLHQWEGGSVGPGEIVSERLDPWTIVDENAQEFRDSVLWLRVSLTDGTYAEAMFGLMEPCSLWKTVVASFFGGRCDAYLGQALRQNHLGPAELEGFVFEVRRLSPERDPPPPLPVPGTRGATGVAWLDNQTLVVTVAPVVVVPDPILSDDAPYLDPDVRPGLFRLAANGSTARRLWEPQDDWYPAAPLPLPDGRIAFVRQPVADIGNVQAASYLCVWSPSGIEVDIALAHRIHQLLKSDREGRSVLALTLGEHQPSFLEIDLETRTTKQLGYHPALYHAAMRSPSGETSVVAREDNATTMGWYLVLVEGRGETIWNLQVRPEHDLLPSWRPDGGELAYLAQVGEIRTAP